ncbi:MAG TPA: hypothetical protein VG992_00780 [Candidatus Saccharimonadales bacterium]|nr:hypothetical protein [Candidatus Saccharimonadales bacterium]
MSVFTPTRRVKEQSKVHHSQYIVNEDAPKETDTKPAEQPLNPEQPEAN